MEKCDEKCYFFRHGLCNTLREDGICDEPSRYVVEK